jgi:hypothetical protein
MTKRLLWEGQEMNLAALRDLAGSMQSRRPKTISNRCRPSLKSANRSLPAISADVIAEEAARYRATTSSLIVTSLDGVSVLNR